MERLKKIKLLAMDVDGVLTDGKMIYVEGGGQARAFHVHDGLGIRMGMLAGLKIALITGNVSPAVARRANDLGLVDVYQGSKHKPEAMRDLMTKYGLSPDEIAFIGDDLNDLPAFAEVGVAFSVSNAVAEAKEAADFITTIPGGSGAVREVIEMILEAQGVKSKARTRFLQELEREQVERETAKVVG